MMYIHDVANFGRYWLLVMTQWVLLGISFKFCRTFVSDYIKYVDAYYVSSCYE